MSREEPDEPHRETPKNWDYSSHSQKAGGLQITLFILCAVVLALTPVAWLLWLWLTSPTPARPQ